MLQGRDHGHTGSQPKESAVILVGLDDKVRTGPGSGIGPEILHDPTDDEGWIQPGLHEDPGDHGTSRRLAVGAGHRDGQLASRKVAQKLLTFDHRQALPPCLYHLRIAGRYRR